MAYAFKRTCSVDHSQCGASDSTDFAVSVVFTDTTMKLVGSGGHINNTVTSHGQTVPADLAFFSDTGLTTALAFEIESYDATAGTIVAWVKIPTLSHTADTLFYMGYDDAAVVTFQGNVSGTWDSNYLAVWHLANGSSLSLLDSTSNAHTLTNVNTSTATTGEIGGGVSVNGTTQYLQSSAQLIGGLSSMSVQVWGNATTTDNASIWGEGLPGVDVSFFESTTFFGPLSVRLFLRGVMNAGPGVFSVFTSGSWAKVDVTLDASAGTVVYQDGSSIFTDASTGTITATSTNGFTFGQDIAGSGATQTFFGGSIDEVRVSNVARPAAHVLSEYNNQKASQTFLSVGAETPTGGGTSFTLTADAGSYSVTGSSVTLKSTRTMSVAAGSYTVTGSAVTLTFSGGSVNYVLTAASGVYVMTGSRVRLVWSGAPAGQFAQCMNIALMGL